MVKDQAVRRNGWLDCGAGATDGFDGGADECKGEAVSYPLYHAGVLASSLFSDFVGESF